MASEICRQKAAFLATASPGKAYDVFCAGIFLVLLFHTIIMVIGIPDDEEVKEENGENCIRPNKNRILTKFLVQTPLLALGGLCLSTVVLANQHHHHCERWQGRGNNEPRNWKGPLLDTPRDWIFTGLFPGLLVVCAILDWLRSGLNVFLARWDKFIKIDYWPPGLVIALIPISSILTLAGLLAFDVLSGIGFLMSEGLKKWMRTEKEQDLEDVELQNARVTTARDANITAETTTTSSPSPPPPYSAV